MKKLIVSSLIVFSMLSGIFAESAFSGLAGAIKSVKKSADSVKEVANTTKKASKKKAEKGVEEEVKNDQPVQLESINGFLIYMNLSDTKITEDMYMDYAKTIAQDTFDKYHNDEFEWADQYATLKTEFDKKVNDVNVDQEFTLLMSADFGDYDFTAAGYKLSISPDTIFTYESIIAKCGGYGYKIANDSIFRNNIALKLYNLDKYNFFEMPKDEAKNFLQGRKNSYGNINRKVSLVVKYEIAGFNSAEYKSFKKLAEGNDYLPLVGLIKSVEIYDQEDNFKKIGTPIQK